MALLKNLWHHPLCDANPSADCIEKKRDMSVKNNLRQHTPM